MPLLVLAHVEADHVLLGVEQGRREGLGQLGLPDAGGAEEDERADGAARVADAGAGTDDGVGDELDGLVLADDPLAQDLVQAQQLLAFALLETGHGDAGPGGDDLGDLLLRDDLAQQPVLALFGGQLLLLGRQPAFQVLESAVAEFGGAVEVVDAFGLLRLVAGLFQFLAQLLHPADGLPLGLPLGVFGVGLAAQVGQFPAQFLQAGFAGGVGLLGQGRLLDLQAGHPAGDLVEFGGHGVDLGAQPGACLVDEVDGLVGQEPVGDVAVAEGGRGDQCGVLDLHAVEDLQAFAQSAQDGDGVLHARLVDQDLLEAAFEGGVLLDVLAVLVEGGGADHVEFTAGEHRLEHVARVHGPFGGARADDGVEFVDEEQDAALGGLHLGQHGLEAFLELAAVLGAGDQGAHVEGEHRPVAQSFGDVAADDALGQPLDDGGLADAGIADEDGVVLGLAAEDLGDAADLRVTADDRVQPSGPGLEDEIAAVLLQCLIGHFGVGGGDALVAADLGERAQERVPGHAVLLEQASGGGRRALLGQGEQEVLHGHVLVLEAFGLPLGGVEQAGQALGDEDLAGGRAGTGDFRAAGEVPLHGRAQLLRPGAGLLQQAGDQTVLLIEKREQQVLPVDLGLPQADGHALGLLEGFLGLLGETVHVHGGVSLLVPRPRRADSSRLMRSSRSSTRPMDA
ncbi:hypothetical protein SGRIM119S_02326 [Streptomyces griseorubiginosus]